MSNEFDELIKQVDASLQSNDLESASYCCACVLATDPNHAIALHRSAIIELKSGNADRTLQLLERSINSDPAFVQALNDYGWLLSELNRMRAAIPVLRRAIEMAPGFTEARVNLGVALHKHGDLKEAEEHYEAALAVDPVNVRALVSLGNLYMTYRRPQEAIDCYQSAVKAAPGFAEAHSALGSSYLAVGNQQLALNSFERAIECQPNHPIANYNLGYKAMVENDYRRAIDYFDKSDSTRARAQLLNCLLFLKEYDEFYDRLAAISARDDRNMLIASISAYAAQQLDRPDIYPFWPDPMSYIRIIDNACGLNSDVEFFNGLVEQIKNLELIWEPKGASTQGGYRSESTLFHQATGFLARLESQLRMQIDLYRNDFLTADALFAKHWPDQYMLEGWFNRLMRGGYQEPHNHPDGWLSGCLYLQVPEIGGDSNEAAIEFSLKSPLYPEITGNNPTRIHIPVSGQLVLFPPSLFHRTIPFDTDEERLAIAFDVMAA